jgi:hypothetical protein
MKHQKKKKASPQLQKQQEAENRKKFFQKIKWLFTLFGHEELFKLVPLKHLEALYKIRYHAPTIHSVGNLPSGIKNEKQLNQDIYSLMKSHTMKIPNTQNKMSYYDYFTSGMDINLGIINLEKPMFTNQEIIQKTLKEMNHKLFIIEILHEKTCYLLSLCHFHYSSFNKGFYVMVYKKEPEISPESTYIPPFSMKFELQEIHRPRPFEIKIDHSVRPVFEVGWLIDCRFVPCSLSATDLFLDPMVYKKPIPVYIQSHAIHRLADRINLVDQGITQFNLYLSLTQNPHIIPMSDKSYLIEYRFEKWKIGYLPADLIGQRLIIRTFLLATQAGTPEEQKFRKITRLTRNDIDYLKMTRLGELAESGIEDNPHLKSIFDEAGLTPLLECASFIYYRSEGTNRFSDQLLKYLTVEQEKPNWHEIAETIEPDTGTETQPFEVVPCDK